MELTSTDWLQAAYYCMDVSMRIGAKIYPLIIGIRIINLIVSVI